MPLTMKKLGCSVKMNKKIPPVIEAAIQSDH